MFQQRNFASFCARLEETSDRDVMQTLINRGILKRPGGCPRCRRPRALGANRAYKGGFAIRCQTCRFFRSLFDGTFFEGSRLPIRQVLQVMFCWCHGISQEDATNMTGVGRCSENQLYRYFRDIASWKILHSPDLFSFGGPGNIVQIDESVIARRKYNRGRRVIQRWVLGIWNPNTKRGLVRYVRQRNADTLLPIIGQHVVRGTTIWTDKWAAYNALPTMGYVHQSVNHSRHFKDPVTGCCTNAVEGMWGTLKRHLRKRSLMWSPLLPEHIDEWMWRKAFNINKANAMQILMAHIAERYPV